MTVMLVYPAALRWSAAERPKAPPPTMRIGSSLETVISMRLADYTEYRDPKRGLDSVLCILDVMTTLLFKSARSAPDCRLGRFGDIATSLSRLSRNRVHVYVPLILERERGVPSGGLPVEGLVTFARRCPVSGVHRRGRNNEKRNGTD